LLLDEEEIDLIDSENHRRLRVCDDAIETNRDDAHLSTQEGDGSHQDSSHDEPEPKDDMGDIELDPEPLSNAQCDDENRKMSCRDGFMPQ
jgi:hypothetical protein